MDQRLKDYIKSENLLSDYEIEMVDRCLNDIKELAPTDKPMLFRKMDNVIKDSQDLAWCVHSIQVKIADLNKIYRKAKDPEYVSLVRMQRPSSEAINSEIRVRNSDIYDYEQKLSVYGSILEYFKYVQSSLDKYLYMLRDKLKFYD